MFILEVGLMLVYGVDYRLVSAGYLGKSFRFRLRSALPLRMLVPFLVALVMTGGIWLYLSRTFTGRAILAVAQDRLALQLMGADPVRIKQFAFGLAIATTSVAGSLLIMIGPVEPSIGRDYIGRVFAIVVLGGMGSISGMFIARADPGRRRELRLRPSPARPGRRRSPSACCCSRSRCGPPAFSAGARGSECCAAGQRHLLGELAAVVVGRRPDSLTEVLHNDYYFNAVLRDPAGHARWRWPGTSSADSPAT